MGLAHESGKNIGKVIEPIRAGDDKIAARKLSVAEDTRTINVTSAAFTDGGSLPVTANSIASSPAGGREGKNSMLKNGYSEGAGRSALLDAMRNHVIAWGEIVATYERS